MIEVRIRPHYPKLIIKFKARIYANTKIEEVKTNLKFFISCMIFLLLCTACTSTVEPNTVTEYINANGKVMQKECSQECWLDVRTMNEDLIRIYVGDKSKWETIQLDKLYTFSFSKTKDGKIELNEIE